MKYSHLLTAHGRSERHGTLVERKPDVMVGHDDALPLRSHVRAGRHVELGASRIEADDVLSRVGEDLATQASEVLADRRDEPIVSILEPEVPCQEAAVYPCELRVDLFLAVVDLLMCEEVVLSAPGMPDPGLSAIMVQPQSYQRAPLLA